MAISLDKVSAEAPGLLSLAKKADDVVARKGLVGHRAKCVLCLDHSGSMRGQYKSGAMQRLAERVIALATRFDDDGDIDVFTFDTSARYVGTLGLSDYEGGIDRLVTGHMGTTNYAEAFRSVTGRFGFETERHGFFGGSKLAPLKRPADYPVYVVFLTDGSPDSKREAKEELIKASYAPVFWQFLSIGSERIEFLQKLDDLSDRYVDNADYKPVGDVDALSDERLYEILLDEYPNWVAEERRRGQIRR